MKSQQIPKTVAEHFAGIGLVRMGLEEAGWQIVFANYFSEKKYEMYAGFFPDTSHHYIIDDIFNLLGVTAVSPFNKSCHKPLVRRGWR